MQQYLDLLDHIMKNGVDKDDRTGTGTRSVFGYQMRFNLQEGFPVLTTKKLHLRSIIGELLWFLRGDTNVRWLQDRGITIWDEWADKNGELGPVYGKQWRSWDVCDGMQDDLRGAFYGKYHHTHTIDQIANVIDSLRHNPDSRRHIVTAWNPAEINQMQLPPCHLLFQFYVRPARDSGAPFLDCQLYQRSCDTFLGVPFNIASYALLTMIMAQQVDMRPGEFVWTGGDVHLYSNHFEQAREQLTRTPKPLPKMEIKRKPASIDKYELEDFDLVGYVADPTIKAPIAV